MVPPTLVTTSEAGAGNFLETHGRVVFKSISGVRSRGDVLLRQLVPGYHPTLASHPQRVRAVVAAMHVLGARLPKAA